MKAPWEILLLALVGCNSAVKLDVGSDNWSGGAAGATNVATGGVTATTSTAAVAGAPLNPLMIPMPKCDNPSPEVSGANWPSAAACAQAASGVPSDLVGTWEGYTEDTYFNHLKKFRLAISAATSGGSVCGSVQCGEGVAPAVSSDPTGWYPPLDSPYYNSGDPATAFRSEAMLDGFTYTIIKGGQLDNQLVISVSAHEQYKDWCGLQSVYPPNTNSESSEWQSYHCLPNLTMGADASGPGCYFFDSSVSMKWPPWLNQPNVAASDAQCAICGMCTCDACHCTASVKITERITLTFSGDTAVGTVVHDPENPYDPSAATSTTIRLSRLQP